MLEKGNAVEFPSFNLGDLVWMDTIHIGLVAGRFKSQDEAVIKIDVNGLEVTVLKVKILDIKKIGE